MDIFPPKLIFLMNSPRAVSAKHQSHVINTLYIIIIRPRLLNSRTWKSSPRGIAYDTVPTRAVSIHSPDQHLPHRDPSPRGGKWRGTQDKNQKLAIKSLPHTYVGRKTPLKRERESSLTSHCFSTNPGQGSLIKSQQISYVDGSSSRQDKSSPRCPGESDVQDSGRSTPKREPERANRVSIINQQVPTC